MGRWPMPSDAYLWSTGTADSRDRAVRAWRRGLAGAPRVGSGGAAAGGEAVLLLGAPGVAGSVDLALGAAAELAAAMARALEELSL